MEKTLSPERALARDKANKTKLRNALNEQVLKATRDKDWTAVTVLCGALYVLAERGEI